MGGRESAWQSGMSPARDRASSGSVVAALEEPSTSGERESRRASIRRPGKAVVEGGSLGSCSLVVLFSKTALEEPFAAAERTSRRGLTWGPGKGLVGGRKPAVMYTSLFEQIERPGGTVRRRGRMDRSRA